MTAKKKSTGKTAAAVDSTFVPVVNAFAKNRQVVGGRMMSSYCLKVNRKIFAISWKGALVVKLPKPRVDELVSQGKGDRFDPSHGRPMKEWLAVEPKKANWVELAKEAYRFVKQAST